MGLRVIALIPGSWAEVAGVKVGDELTMINDKPINDAADFFEAIKDRQLRSAVSQVVKVIREGEELTFEMALGKPNLETLSN